MAKAMYDPWSKIVTKMAMQEMRLFLLCKNQLDVQRRRCMYVCL